MNLKAIMDPYAELYWSGLPAFKTQLDIFNTTGTLIPKNYKSSFINSFKWPLKHSGEWVPPGASEEALKIAQQHNIDLHALQWKDQKQAEKLIHGKNSRITFIHEHQIPVSELFNNILSASSIEEISYILENQKIAWITRDEDKRLPKSKRKGDEYEKEGIKVISNPYGHLWMNQKWNKNIN
jgi:hypothetical protein